MWLCLSSTSMIEDRDSSTHLNILTTPRTSERKPRGRPDRRRTLVSARSSGPNARRNSSLQASPELRDPGCISRKVIPRVSTPVCCVKYGHYPTNIARNPISTPEFHGGLENLAASGPKFTLRKPKNHSLENLPRVAARGPGCRHGRRASRNPRSGAGDS